MTHYHGEDPMQFPSVPPTIPTQQYPPPPPPSPQAYLPPYGAVPVADPQMSQIMRQQLAESVYQDQRKSEGTAYAFWFFLGLFGGHRFYAGDVVQGILMLLTLGGVGIWWLADVFFIGRRIRNVNADKRRQVFSTYGLPVA